MESWKTASGSNAFWGVMSTGEVIAQISLPAEVRDVLEAYAKERGMEVANLFSLAIDQVDS
jgi:hypothetical protein